MLCLMLSEGCLTSAYNVFNANVSYVVQVNYGEPMMAASLAVLGWAVFDGLGVLLMWLLQSKCQVSVWRMAMYQLLAVSLAGLFSLYLGNYWHSLWAYLLASLLQGFLVTSALVPLNVLFFEPLKDGAGVAASVEIMFKNLPSPVYSMLSTQVLVHRGMRGFMDMQSAAFVAAGLFGFSYAGLQLAGSRERASERNEEADEVRNGGDEEGKEDPKRS